MLLLISPASAKFICGEVASSDKTSPAWFGVTTYLSSNENTMSSCQVSPSNNRYCCELSKDKMGYQWKAGDIFKAKVTDPSSGYFAKPQNLTLTGEGYDIAPILTLEKAIQITSPKTALTISKTPIQIQSNISTHCTNQTSSGVNTTFGKNNIVILATCNNEEFETNQTFFVIQNITFQKTYSGEFKGSQANPKIKSSKTGTVMLQATLSHEVENIQLKEYVPSSWEVSSISNNETLQFSTPEYNVITWQINADNFSVNYKVKAPSTGFRPEEFTFKTILDQHDLDETKLLVYKFIPLPITPKINHGGYVYIPKKLSKVSQKFPLIFQNDDLTAALYSKAPIQQGSLNLLDFLYQGKIDRNFDYLKSYQIQTTLNSTERGKMAIEYKTNKTFLEENSYKEIAFFEKHKGKFLRITGAVISSGDNEIKYRFESAKAPSEIFILAEKNSLTILDKILNFLDKIRFWQ